MDQNPQKIILYKEFCKKHTNNVLQYVCDRQNCDYFLTFQCFQCRQDNVSDHSHECPKVKIFVKKLHDEVIGKLSAQIKNCLNSFQKELSFEIHELRNNLQYWYSPLDETATQKQFVHTVQNPSKWEKIQQLARMKDKLIEYRLKQLTQKYKRDMQQITNIINAQINQLKYRITPVQWKFDKNYCHQLLTVSGLKDRTIDKKSEKQIYCVAIMNQPMTPLKNQISFTINSQNQNDQLVVIGVCEKKQLVKKNLQTDLKKGIFGIYQAAKAGSRNNAFSLHSSNPEMHYKQSVGWNFRSGDTIVIIFSILESGMVRIQFRKKKDKQLFQFTIQKYNCFLHPFVALFGSGDKVSIDFT